MSTNLPDECWESVFKFLDHYRYFELLSLVSKQFLSITNRLRFSLTICDPTLPYLLRLFTRFPMLRSLDLTCFTGDLNALLHQISLSPLSLHSLDISGVIYRRTRNIPVDGFRSLGKNMKTLKSLVCSFMGSITNSDLLLIADCFPFLEELDISYPSRNNDLGGVEELSLALPKLRKVNLYGNYFINNSLFLNLCKNCEFLEQIKISVSDRISKDDIASAIKTRPNLTSLSVADNHRFPNVGSDFFDSLVSLKSLTCIKLKQSCISDELLFSVSKEGLPLRKLVLNSCKNYSYAGIFCLVSKCKLVQHLDLENAWFLKDEHISGLSVLLGNLMSINLTNCHMLTNLSFFALTKNCPLLSKIIMRETSVGENGVEDSLIDLVVNSQMKSLNLACNSIRDEDLEVFASICPNLQLLDLDSCRSISKGVVEVLKRCPKLTHLYSGFNSEVKLFGMNFQVPLLEVLDLSFSGIDDEALFIISKSCCWLLDLNIRNCSLITAKGVKQVIDNCKQLREINMYKCHEVAANVVDWMVSARPSLRKILAPPSFCLSDRQRECFLRHGCVVEVQEVLSESESET